MQIKKKKVLFVLGIILLLVSSAFAQQWRVDAQGNITRDGQIFRVKGGSWFGLEGRHEPSNDPDNPSGAPMEMYMGNVFWAESGRTYDQDVQEIKQMGFNVVRLPVVPQTLDASDPQGMAPYLKNAPSVRIENARLAMETVIQKLDAAGIYVLLDIHSCSNYVGWRAGRFDARPPYADADRDQYDFTREDCSCASSGNPSGVTQIDAYNTSAWLSDLSELAGLSSELGVSNIIGIDIFNEPWDYTWQEWRGYIDQAYSAINSVNSDILVFAQGISATAGNQDGTPNTITQVPHGIEELNPNWGENLFEAGDNPPTMPKNRLVYSPHTYGPSVFVQKMFMDPNQPQCEGLEGDETGDEQCNIVINPTLLEQGWQEHFGYLKAMGYAIVIGEWGGNPDWPDNAELRMQDRYNYITDRTVDWQWQNAFVDYLISAGITDTIYWSINPESGDTGGIYGHAYDPVSNTGGWGTWTQPEQRKLDLLARLWNATVVLPTPTPVGQTPTPVTNTPTPVGQTPTPTPVVGTGAVNFSQTSYSVAAGGTLTTDIVSAVSAPVASYGIIVSFDPSVVSYVSAADNGFGMAPIVNSSSNSVTLTAFSTSPSAGNGIATITWSASNTNGASGIISIQVDTLTDASYNNLGTTGGSASVTVGGTKGDVNGDGNVTIVDALMIAQISVGLSAPVQGNTDINCDGNTTIVDALMVAQFSVGLLAAFPC